MARRTQTEAQQMMPQEEFTFTVRNDLSEVDSLHEKVKGFGRQLGLPEKFIFEVNLAAEELFTNIVLYGFEDKDDHAVDVFLRCDEGRLRMRIEDDGKPFNPLDAGDPDLSSPPEDRSVGGLGVYLAEKVMDRIHYERRGNRNVTSLVKKLV